MYVPWALLNSIVIQGKSGRQCGGAEGLLGSESGRLAIGPDVVSLIGDAAKPLARYEANGA